MSAPADRGAERAGAEAERPEISIHALHDAIAREHREPREGSEPAPVWLIFLYLGIVGWIGAYLGLYGAGFAADRYSHRPPTATVAVEALDRPRVDPVTVGKRLFAIHCASCHQASGEGLKGTYPPLAGSAWLLEDPATPVRILLRGLGGPIEVSRAEYNGSMPSFGERLSDEHIAAVLTFARQQWGNDAAAVEAPFVTAVRAQIDRAAPWTAPELLTARATPIDWTPSDGAASGAETP